MINTTGLPKMDNLAVLSHFVTMVQLLFYNWVNSEEGVRKTDY